MRRWSDLLCAFPNAARAGAENATINAKATRSLLMMLSFYDVDFHVWIIKGDSMEASSIPIASWAALSLSRVTRHESSNGWPLKSHYQHRHGRSGTGATNLHWDLPAR